MIPKLIRFYASRDITLVKGYMQYVWDDKGKKYLDCNTGHGVAFLGHLNPYVVNEIKNQLEKIIAVSTSFENDVRNECLKLLGEILPKDLCNVYFQNSGTEAVELALKIARKVTKRKTIVAFKNSFHGRTLGSLMITWNPKYRLPFVPSEASLTKFLKFNDPSAVDKEIDENTAAIVVEPVQGEGGVNPATFDFLRALRVRADEVGCVLVFDEIQCGFGRTGKIWAHQHHNIKPDIITAGKSIGGGFPVSFVAIKDFLASELEIGDHGTTHGGNPLACAALIGGIKALVRDNVIDKVNNITPKLHKTLIEINESHRLIRGFKGLGLMVGLELRISPANILKKLQDKGLLALKAGLTVLRLLPPYMITDEDVSFIGEVIEDVIREEESARGLS